jgi:hypothetical protein
MPSSSRRVSLAAVNASRRGQLDPGSGDVGGMAPCLVGGDKCFWRKDVGYSAPLGEEG